MYKDEKFWDRLSSQFDKIEAGDIAYKFFIEKARGILKSNDTVLDFGCGTGLICNEIAPNVGFIHAIDISSKMIQIAKDKASERGIQNIDFEQTNIFDEKLNEGSFDIIIAFNILHLLEEPQKYLVRMSQLLKPDGYILSATPCMDEAKFLNFVLKFFSVLGMTPKLNSFTSSEMEQLFFNVSFKTVELNRIKPKSPQYLFFAAKEVIARDIN